MALSHLVVFVVMGAAAAGIVVRVATITQAMAAALLAADPKLDQRYRLTWHTNVEAGRITSEYKRRFPSAPLTAKLHQAYWAMAVWFGLSGCLLFAL